MIPIHYTGYTVCRDCGWQFSDDGHATCVLCRKARAILEMRQWGRTPKKERECHHCHKKFTVPANAKYCSEGCRKAADAERKRTWRSKQKQCPVCKNMYWPKTPAAKYCHNPDCKRAGARVSEERYLAKARDEQAKGAQQ